MSSKIKRPRKLLGKYRKGLYRRPPKDPTDHAQWQAFRLANPEPPSRVMDRVRVVPGPLTQVSITGSVQHWENSFYYGLVNRYSSGSPLGGGPYVRISITSNDETALHDWRDFQAIKNMLAGPEWTAVELYPAESNLRDPSNRFYLFAFPPGVITWGMDPGRLVLDAGDIRVPQRPFPLGYSPPRGGVALDPAPF